MTVSQQIRRVNPFASIDGDWYQKKLESELYQHTAYRQHLISHFSKYQLIRTVYKCTYFEYFIGVCPLMNSLFYLLIKLILTNKLIKVKIL